MESSQYKLSDILDKLSVSQDDNLMKSNMQIKMTKKYQRLLFIILVLLIRLRNIEAETNQYISAIEQDANEKLKALAQRQIELDQLVLDNWQGNAQELWNECQRLEAENRELKRKLERELRY